MSKIKDITGPVKYTVLDQLIYKLKCDCKRYSNENYAEFRLGINHAINEAKKFKAEQKEQFVKFFVWFRDNGEKHIGKSIEEFVDIFFDEYYK